MNPLREITAKSAKSTKKNPQMTQRTTDGERDFEPLISANEL